LPKVFVVNWFRKSPEGKWLWPGFGENSRVLKWICERIEGNGKAVETPVGWLPADGALDARGLNLSPTDLKMLLSVDPEAWRKEIEDAKTYFDKFGDKLPPKLRQQLLDLDERLAAMQMAA